MKTSSDASYTASVSADWEWLYMEKINSAMTNRSPEKRTSLKSVFL